MTDHIIFGPALIIALSSRQWPGRVRVPGCGVLRPGSYSAGALETHYEVVLETKVIRMFPKISQSRRRPLVTFKTLLRHYAKRAMGHPSLMIIALGTQFHVYLPWG